MTESTLRNLLIADQIGYVAMGLAFLWGLFSGLYLEPVATPLMIGNGAAFLTFALTGWAVSDRLKHIRFSRNLSRAALQAEQINQYYDKLDVADKIIARAKVVSSDPRLN